ncbi:MAG: DUF4830 domain-containing protein [Oscillospiraceae bacterium]|jgi:hypothetical protein
MFVKTVKVKKPNPIAVVVVLAAVLILIAVWVLDFGGSELKDKYKLSTNTERISFLEELGWEVSQLEIDCKIVKIPADFNETYLAYNKLQKQQGFDLSDYKGMTVEIYTYEVYNYPDKPSSIVVHLVVFEGTLIAGDVCCTELNGFMHGLMPIDEEGMKNNGSSITDEETIAPAQTTAPAETVIVIGTEATDFPEK